MSAPNRLTPQEALVCTMVLVSAADGGMTDREIGTMAGIAQTLPSFRGFGAGELQAATGKAIALLGEADGIETAFSLIRDALAPRLRETAYALACEVIAADGSADQDELNMLEMAAEGLELDKLTAGAIERAARARHQRI
jgi:tellurite resistance protein